MIKNKLQLFITGLAIGLSSGAVYSQGSFSGKGYVLDVINNDFDLVTHELIAPGTILPASGWAMVGYGGYR